MATSLTVERCAELRAEMEAGRLRDEVLSGAGISAEEWTVAQRAWLDRMGAELLTSRFELTNRYTQAFVERQRALKALAAPEALPQNGSHAADAAPEPATPVPPVMGPLPAAPPMVGAPPSSAPSPWAEPPRAPAPAAPQITGYGGPPPSVRTPAPHPAAMGATVAGAISPFAVGAALPFARAPEAAGAPPRPAAPPKAAPPAGAAPSTGTAPPAAPKPGEAGNMSTVIGAISPFAPGAALPFAAKPSGQESGATPAPAATTGLPFTPTRQSQESGIIPAPVSVRPAQQQAAQQQAAPQQAPPAAPKPVPPPAPSQPAAAGPPPVRPSQTSMPVVLTLEQHASLCAELAHNPAHGAETLARYRVSPQAKAEMDKYWQARFQQDHAANAKWQEAYRIYFQFLSSRRG